MTVNLQRTQLLIQAIAVVFLSPLPVYAHHCSSLSDCWNTAAAAAAAAVGAAALAALAALFRWITDIPRSPRVSPPKSREKRVPNSCRIG
jgi:hypothetical protein